MVSLMGIDLSSESREVDQIALRIASLQESIKKEERSLASVEEDFKHAQAAQDILQHIAQAVQQQAHQRISKVVSTCLSTVFEDPYELKIEFERKRGRTEAQLRFVRRDLDLCPLSSSGGGVIDVASFALRVACLMLHRPRLSRVLVLDEPFKYVSTQYRDNVRKMLEELSEDMGIQFIMVTHSEELETGKVISI